jgi:endoglucanase
VVFENGAKGVLVPESGISDTDWSSADKFYIDLGTTSKKQTEKKVRIGDFAVVEGSLTKLSGRRYVGRPFDDRIGCAVLIECLKNSRDSQNDLYFVFTTADEVGARGALPAAFNVEPDYSLAVDVTATGDVPGAKPMAVKLGGGAAIKIRDNSAICDVRIVEKLTDVAKAEKIKHQHEILARGGTDTGSMQRSGRGSVAGAVSIPTRYIHSSVEMIDMADVDACVKLISEFVKLPL